MVRRFEKPRSADEMRILAEQARSRIDEEKHKEENAYRKLLAQYGENGRAEATEKVESKWMQEIIQAAEKGQAQAEIVICSDFEGDIGKETSQAFNKGVKEVATEVLEKLGYKLKFRTDKYSGNCDEGFPEQEKTVMIVSW